MVQFMIHTPINIRAYLTEYIKKNLTALEDEIKDDINILPSTTNLCQNWMQTKIKNNCVPDVMMALGTDYAFPEAMNYNQLFELHSTSDSDKQNNSIRKEFQPYEDPNSIFKPIFFVPIAIIYNTNLVKKEELSHSWQDLLNDKFKVIMPFEYSPISKTVVAGLEAIDPERSIVFRREVAYGGTPVEVAQAVKGEKFHIGICSLSFALMAKSQDVDIIWPEEGMMLLPQILVWKKGMNFQSKTREMLLDQSFQEYLGRQGFWPVNEKAFLHGFTDNNHWIKTWKGWDHYIRNSNVISSGG